jgi:hypothetical protein
MPKVTLTDITSGYTSATQINDNNDLIETAIDNTLSRDGTTPNSMGADIDMNSNDLLNVENIQAVSLTLNGTGVTPAEIAATPAASAITVSDAGGYFAGANVEAVLQDVGAAYTKYDAAETITADWTFQGDNTFQGDDTVEGSLGFNDNVKAQFGTGNDIDIYHNGTKGIIDAISSGTLDIQTTGSSRMDITDSGVRLGGANARVTTVIDDNTMATASDTTLATSESIVAYADAEIAKLVAGSDAVGALAFAGVPPGTNLGGSLSFGDTVSGSNLQGACIVGSSGISGNGQVVTLDGTSLTGTWKCLGYLADPGGDGTTDSATLFVRVS